MKRVCIRHFLPLYFLLCLLLSYGCDRPQLHKTYTVGVVSLNPEHNKIFLGFKKGLAESGYIEGKNITFINPGPRPDVTELEKDLLAFVERKVDLILALSTPVAQKTKQITAGTEIPVVFAPVFDPVRSGIVQSLVHPGGNLTGIKVGGNSSKALDWLLKVSPDIKNIAVPFNGSNKATAQSLRDLQQAAGKAGVNLTVYEANDRKELETLLETLPDTPDALWLLNSNFLVRNMELFVNAAIKNKLPLGSSTSQVDAGVMVSYGQNAFRTGELAAGLAQRILQGISPADLPVEYTDFFLGINLVTAGRIGVDISDDILQVADTIIRP
jgi:putative ABC transport system substrate-binding protein